MGVRWKHYKQSVIKSDWALSRRTWSGSLIWGTSTERWGRRGKSSHVWDERWKQRGRIGFSQAAFTSTSPFASCRRGEDEESRAPSGEFSRDGVVTRLSYQSAYSSTNTDRYSMKRNMNNVNTVGVSVACSSPWQTGAGWGGPAAAECHWTHTRAKARTFKTGSESMPQLPKHKQTRVEERTDWTVLTQQFKGGGLAAVQDRAQSQTVWLPTPEHRIRVCWIISEQLIAWKPTQTILIPGLSNIKGIVQGSKKLEPKNCDFFSFKKVLNSWQFI